MSGIGTVILLPHKTDCVQSSCRCRSFDKVDHDNSSPSQVVDNFWSCGRSRVPGVVRVFLRQSNNSFSPGDMKSSLT